VKRRALVHLATPLTHSCLPVSLPASLKWSQRADRGGGVTARRLRRYGEPKRPFYRDGIVCVIISVTYSRIGGVDFKTLGGFDQKMYKSYAEQLEIYWFFGKMVMDISFFLEISREVSSFPPIPAR